MYKEERSFDPKKRKLNPPTREAKATVNVEVELVSKILEFLFNPFESEQSTIFDELRSKLSKCGETTWKPLSIEPSEGLFIYKAKICGKEKVWTATAKSVETAGATSWAYVPTDDDESVAAVSEMIEVWEKVNEFDDPVERASYFTEHLSSLR